MIVGLGIDVCEVDRIGAMVARWGDRFTGRVFTAGEREYAGARALAEVHLAARFAAKEAALKALAVPPGLSWQELEVVGGGRVRPELVLHGRAREAADRLGVVRVHLTLSHTTAVATAVVVAEADG
jgi:holo-[acyl-carrier protein] synthase